MSDPVDILLSRAVAGESFEVSEADAWKMVKRTVESLRARAESAERERDEAVAKTRCLSDVSHKNYESSRRRLARLVKCENERDEARKQLAEVTEELNLVSAQNSRLRDALKMLHTCNKLEYGADRCDGCEVLAESPAASLAKVKAASYKRGAWASAKHYWGMMPKTETPESIVKKIEALESQHGEGK